MKRVIKYLEQRLIVYERLRKNYEATGNEFLANDCKSLEDEYADAIGVLMRIQAVRENHKPLLNKNDELSEAVKKSMEHFKNINDSPGLVTSKELFNHKPKK